MSVRCWFEIHDMRVVFHSGPNLWCNVGYECRRCGKRSERHEDHWADRHRERGIDDRFYEAQP